MELTIIPDIIEAMLHSKQGTPFQCLYDRTNSGNNRNQFCFYLKPSVLERHPEKEFNEILEILFSSFRRMGFSVQALYVLSGPYLAKHRIIQQHYDMLYCIAESAVPNMTSSMRTNFQEHYGVSVEEVTILGGDEFIKQFPEFNVNSLAILWENIEHKKIGASAFCGKANIGNDTIYLMNGFVPKQLTTYIPSERALPVFVLEGDLSWKTARNNFLGIPDPAKAAAGSLRNEFFKLREKLKISELSLAKNGSHLSAGPLEALIELRRFTTNFEIEKEREITQFVFGELLVKYFSPFEIDQILSNPSIQWKGAEKKLFEITEELEMAAALDVISSKRDQLQQLGSLNKSSQSYEL